MKTVGSRQEAIGSTGNGIAALFFAYCKLPIANFLSGDGKEFETDDLVKRRQINS